MPDHDRARAGPRPCWVTDPLRESIWTCIPRSEKRVVIQRTNRTSMVGLVGTASWAPALARQPAARACESSLSLLPVKVVPATATCYLTRCARAKRSFPHALVSFRYAPPRSFPVSSGKPRNQKWGACFFYSVLDDQQSIPQVLFRFILKFISKVLFLADTVPLLAHCCRRLPGGCAPSLAQRSVTPAARRRRCLLPKIAPALRRMYLCMYYGTG